MVDVNNYDFKYFTDKLLNQKNILLICASTDNLNQETQLVQPEKCVGF